jgi:hypothetical protein
MRNYLLLITELIRTGLRRHGELVAENLLLRHQLAVLTRPAWKRPRLRACDRPLWVVAPHLRRRGPWRNPASDPGSRRAGTTGLRPPPVWRLARRPRANGSQRCQRNQR